MSQPRLPTQGGATIPMSALVQPAAAGPAGRTRPRGATIPMSALVQPDSWAHVRNQSWSVITPHDGQNLWMPRRKFSAGQAHAPAPALT